MNLGWNEISRGLEGRMKGRKAKLERQRWNKILFYDRSRDESTKLVLFYLFDTLKGVRPKHSYSRDGYTA